MNTDIPLLGTVLTALSILGMVWAWFGRRAWQEFREHRAFQTQFRRDWMGEPPRPGVAARPGVMESLAEIRGGWTAITERLRKAEVDLIKLRSEVTVLHNRISKVEVAVEGEGVDL